MSKLFNFLLLFQILYFDKYLLILAYIYKNQKIFYHLQIIIQFSYTCILFIDFYNNYLKIYINDNFLLIILSMLLVSEKYSFYFVFPLCHCVGHVKWFLKYFWIFLLILFFMTTAGIFFHQMVTSKNKGLYNDKDEIQNNKIK